MTFRVESAMDAAGLNTVRIEIGGESFEVEPQLAHVLARDIERAATAAETDAIILRFLMRPEGVNASRDEALQMLENLRALRRDAQPKTRGTGA